MRQRWCGLGMPSLYRLETGSGNAAMDARISSTHKLVVSQLGSTYAINALAGEQHTIVNSAKHKQSDIF